MYSAGYSQSQAEWGVPMSNMQESKFSGRMRASEDRPQNGKACIQSRAGIICNLPRIVKKTKPDPVYRTSGRFAAALFPLLKRALRYTQCSGEFSLREPAFQAHLDNIGFSIDVVLLPPPALISRVPSRLLATHCVWPRSRQVPCRSASHPFRNA